MRSPAPLVLLLLAGPAAAQPKQLPPNLVAPTGPLAPADERKAFAVPAGFEVQLVASEPDIQKPMQMAWDAKGRLWVTTSYHYPFAAEPGKATDKLFVLSDFDPATGKARKVQTFTSDLNIPIGVLPLPDCKSVIVSSVGEIRKYTDADADGKADGPPEVLFTGFGSVDTHGMTNSFTLMPDGWVYACHGFKNESTVKGKDGHEVKMQSGHTFRFRPDGSRIEVYTRGQVNPFGMAVDPWFNLYTADCHSKPVTQLIPGAYYDSFGKPHDGLGFGPHVTKHDHGSTGLCGVTWYDADHFPKDYCGCVFVGNVVTNRINFDRIEWRGASPVAKELPDFLTSTDRWFRPVDLKLGPDGALYVADFYNKIIGHYEVPLTYPGRDKDRGRLWRVVWKGKSEPEASATVGPKFAYTDLTTAKPAALDELLGHPNLAVRLAATNQAIHRAEDMRARDEPSDVYAAHRLWVDEVRAWGQKGHSAKRADHAGRPLVQSHAYRVDRATDEWERGGRDPADRVVQKLAAADPHVARAVAEFVAGRPRAAYAPALVDLLKAVGPDDTHLRHAARIALRNCLRDDAKAWPPFEDAEKLREGFDPIYAEVAVAIPSGRAAAYLLSQLAAKTLAPDRSPAAAEHAVRYGDGRTRVEIVLALTKPGRDPFQPEALLAALRGLSAAGDRLTGPLAMDALNAAEAEITACGEFESLPTAAEAKRMLAAIRVLLAVPGVVTQPADLKPRGNGIARLAQVLLMPKADPDLRVASAQVLMRYDQATGRKFGSVTLRDPVTPEAVRNGILVSFAASDNREARLDARDALKDAPYRLAVTVGTALAGTPGGADDLLNAVRIGKAPARLLQEKVILERLRAAKVADLDQQVAVLTKGLPPLDARLADLIKKRAAAFASAKPDVEAGAKLFAKHCAACHRIADQGGKIAPQLDGIGVRGLERLLEDTLDPNRNVDLAFRARVITTKDEKTVTGLMLRVEGEVLVVADGEGKEVRVPTAEIAANRETMLSPMPANFGDVIPEAEFAHLAAYLLSQRPK
ncbi:MAG: dehydrogenase [Isosphaera sp.]|nr:dehydrogenase [Isosphaera sp.]